MAWAGTAAAGQNWTPLRYFNLYRATLSGTIITLGFFGVAPRYFGQTEADLFWYTAVLYFSFSFVSALTIHARWGGFRTQVVTQVFADIVAITLMMHASGGVASGFGMLLVVAIAGGSILTEGRIAILFAAMASLAVLAHQLYAWHYHVFSSTSYSQAGMLGITFFATAFLAHVLAKRARASEDLAAQRGVDLANLAQLNDHIIQRMQSGVLVLDDKDQVRLMNSSARKLLGLGAERPLASLEDVAPELAELRRQWRSDAESGSQMFKPREAQVEVVASFARLGVDRSRGALVYLEDGSAMRQRAQQLKLASLGRLTASIAHEIRNPLGAISHAGQLLAETPELGKGEIRLTQIIQENCQRMNAMVENILQLSRRKEAVPEQLALAPWLKEFVLALRSQRGLAEQHVKLSVEAPELRVRMDTGQLHQVLWNLCENGLRHAGEGSTVELRAGIDQSNERPFLEVRDDGVGIDEAIADNLFEPFFTTQADGTGLGLYIARELCEINQASLNLVRPAERGTCFRISFSHPDRRGAVS